MSGWMAAVAAVIAYPIAPVVAAEPLTPEAAVQTGRIVFNEDLLGYGTAATPWISISPGGERWAARVARGDVAANGVWLELYSGGLSSVEAAAANRMIGRLLTSGLGSPGSVAGPESDTLGSVNALRWTDERHFTFIFSNARRIRQVVSIDARTGASKFLTDHPTQIWSYDVGKDDLVVYRAQARASYDLSSSRMRSGFAIDRHTDVLALMRGDVSGQSYFDRMWNAEWFVQRSGAQPRKISIGGRSQDIGANPIAKISPDGRRAIILTSPMSVPSEWDRYADSVDFKARNLIAEARRAPSGLERRLLSQYYVVDLRDATSKPLMNSVIPSLAQVPGQIVWSPDSRSVLIAPTYLPVTHSDSTRVKGRAAITVDAMTGAIRRIPITISESGVQSAIWDSANKVTLVLRRGDAALRHRFRLVRGEWQALENPTAVPVSTVRIELREDMETPPALYAVDAARGEERKILDPNPRLRERYALGRVEYRQGTLKSGERWGASIFYPAEYRPERRYPLIMQSEYYAAPPAKPQFSLYGVIRSGGGLGPTYEVPYAGRLLAARDIFVAHLFVAPKFYTSDEAQGVSRVFESLAEQLVAEGLIDRDKVAIAGFSRNGWYVEYTLTHSEFPFAAAIAVDNWDASYLQSVLAGSSHGGESELVNGGPPFGAHLAGWLSNAPGFNVERMRAPLLKIGLTGGLLGGVLGWEVFDRMRRLQYPVEFYFPPDLEHSVHNTQNPAQIIAIQHRVIDWCDFWLNEREDPAEAKREQYVRWHKLRGQRDAALRQPRSPRLKWTATPVTAP